MKKEIQIMIDYVEGIKNINEFRHDLESNLALQNFLKKKVKEPHLSYYNYNYYEYIYRQYQYIKNWDIIYVRSNLQDALEDYLTYFGYSSKKYPKYYDDYMMLLDIQPSWLDCVDDQGIFDQIIAEIPQNLSKSKRIQWGKLKLKELFRYDKTYPCWVQSPEWPIVNGKPLIFSHQKRAGKDDERTFFYFYDPETKEETIVTQIY